MFKQIIVRSDFIIPDVYIKGNTEEIEEALWIGATIQQSIKTRRSNDEVRKITELKDSELNRIQLMYNEKLTKLLSDIQTISSEKDRMSMEYSEGLKNARVTERDFVSHEWDEKMRNLKMEHDVLISRCDVLEARRKLLEDSRDKDINDSVKRTEELMEKLVVSKQEQLHKMELTYARLNETIVKQSEEITKLSSNLNKRSANIKTKGSDYEEEFYEKLKRSYGLCKGFVLRDTSKLGHEMDFTMEMEGNLVMWEVKTYTSTVPKSEVEKFLRDLKENSSKIGVMISRSTDIYGKYQSGNMFTEFDNDKMMIYINKFEEFCGDDENRIFNMLASLFRIWWEYHREEKTFDRVEIVRELEKAVDDISKRRTDWKRHKSHLDELTRWTTDLIDESENRLDRILKKTRNVDVNAPIIPGDVFRESTEKELGWITSIMKVCQIGGEIEVRELVELLGGYHKLSKDTIRSNIMSVVKDSAVMKKGVIKYITGITKKDLKQ